MQDDSPVIEVSEIFHSVDSSSAGAYFEDYTVLLDGEEVFKTSDKYVAYMFAAELKMRSGALKELQKNLNVQIGG